MRRVAYGLLVVLTCASAVVWGDDHRRAHARPLEITCPGALPSRLRTNQPAQVIARNGTNLRESPGINAPLLRGLPENAVILVLAGPVCSDGYAWWEVRHEGRTGWTAEAGRSDYWLLSLAPEYRQLTYDNVRLLLDRRIAPSGTAERKLRTPVYRADGMELVSLPHIRFSFDDRTAQANVSVFDVGEYNPLLAGALDRLDVLIRTRPDYLDMFALPPQLPATDMQRILIAQAQFLNFDGGTGLRFVGYFSHSPGAITADDLYYIYLGLTDDESQFVQAFIPLRADFLPLAGYDDLPYAQYLARAQDILDHAAPERFSPSLAVLDDLIDQLQITPRRTPPANIAQLGRMSFTVPESVSRQGAVGVSVPADDPRTAAFPLPAHTRFTLNGVPTLGDLPHVAVFPAAEYNFQFVGAIDELTRYLQARVPTAEPPQRLPIAENRARLIAAQVAYLDFENGAGVRFVIVFREGVAPITADRATYVYLGITADGAQFVQALIPLTAGALPATPPPDYDASAFIGAPDDFVAYVAQARRDLDNASPQSFTPRLDALDSMMRSLNTRR